MNNKAQLEVQETIIVVFIFVVILSIGLVLFYKFQIASLDQQKQEIQEKKFEAMLLIFPNIAEIECSSNLQTQNCIDLLKVLSLKKLIETNPQIYFNKFGYKKIQLKLIYPTKNDKECTSENLNDCGVWTIYNKPSQNNKEGGIILRTPVSVYHPETEDYGIAELILEAYEL